MVNRRDVGATHVGFGPEDEHLSHHPEQLLGVGVGAGQPPGPGGGGHTEVKGRNQPDYNTYQPV